MAISYDVQKLEQPLKKAKRSCHFKHIMYKTMQ